ncbi:hypothetical protein [Methylobacterium sp. E-045]|uniref:hypothetical protein n=1 Tax=Methylobacterium sp. E-045 TaxID=2836575 RepID=UPI0028BDB146|nr:hypothetical protein [Methylobacterium sp. E-045]
MTNNIKAPILTVLGSADKLFVQPDYVAEATDEHKWYTGSSSQQTLVVPGAGHDLQLEYASQYYSKEIFDWIDRTAGNPHGGSVISAGGGDDVQAGDDKANTLIDGPGNDILIGNGGDDTFTTGSGTNIIDGGNGIDKAIFGFNFNDATFDFHSNAVTISSGDSINTLKGVEQFQFADRTIDNNDNSPLVDDLFYLAHNKDVFAAGQDADTHYAEFGFKEGRDPNAFFSTKGYLATNPDVAKSGGNPLVDYDQNGWKQGHDPSANFDNELYLARNPDVKAAGIDPLAHFLSDGQAEGRQAYAAIGKATDIGAAHGFDAEYYLLSNPDVAQAALAAGGDTFAFAQQHFNQLGWHEGRNPNAVFDTKGYLAAYEDVAANGINPLTHYDTFGWKEGRDPSADFDTKAYEATYADVKAQGLDPLVHYLQFGAVENRSTFGDGHFS